MKSNRIAFISDAHIGNHTRLGGHFECGANHRARCAVRVLKWAYEAIHAAGDIKTVCILGDLFESTRPTPQVMSIVGQIFNTYRNVGINTILLPGNHDSNSEKWNDHALGVYQWAGIKVIENYDLVKWKDGTIEILFVVPRPGVVRAYLDDIMSRVWSEYPNATVYDVPPSKHHMVPAFRILALHSGLVHTGTPQYHLRDQNSINVQDVFTLMDKYKISNVFSGHWHHHTQVAPTVWQIGALAQNGWKDRGCDVGCICVLNPSNNDVTVIRVPGPRFVSVNSLFDLEDFLLSARDLYPAHTSLFIEAVVHASELDVATNLLSEAESWLEVSLIELRWTLLPSTENVRQSVCESVYRARGDIVTESCERYVHEMPLDDTVQRTSVITRVLNYIRR